MNKKIAFGADHAGYILKENLLSFLKQLNIETLDCGTFSEESTDYPLYAQKVVQAVLTHESTCGVLICGSGIGMSIAANRFLGIRAALCWNIETAKLSRQHNDANILVLGARMIKAPTAQQCLTAFLDTSFSQEERHKRRVRSLDQIC